MSLKSRTTYKNHYKKIGKKPKNQKRQTNNRSGGLQKKINTDGRAKNNKKQY